MMPIRYRDAFFLALAFGFLAAKWYLLPVQYDEAVTVLGIGNNPFTTYHNGTNNHVLLSFILQLLHSTNIHVLRLPSLAAGFFVLLAAQRIAKRVPYGFLLPFVIVSVPLFNDYLVMARGYSLGIAFLLWGWMDDNEYRRGFLYGLATCCVPTFALDVLILWAAKREWKTLAIAVLLPLACYAFILPNVVAAVLTAGGDGFTVLQFARNMHALAGYAVFIACCACVWFVRKETALSVPTLLSILALFVGYPRTHLLTAFLLLLCLVTVTRKRWGVVLFAAFAVSALFTMTDRIHSEPETWSVSAISVARRLVPCISVERKGFLSVPIEYYHLNGGQYFDETCPYIILRDDSSRPRLEELRLYADMLSTYGVGLFKLADLEAYNATAE